MSVGNSASVKGQDGTSGSGAYTEGRYGAGAGAGAVVVGVAGWGCMGLSSEEVEFHGLAPGVLGEMGTVGVVGVTGISTYKKMTEVK